MNQNLTALNELPDTPILDVVRVVIVDREGRVLLVKEFDDENWKLPGGKIHANETIMQAIEREIMEELGCKIQPDHILTYVKKHIPHSEHFRHIVKAHIPADVPQATDEVVELLWADPAALPESDFKEHISTAIGFVAD
jgi:8-oxo-dGTP diphosphatase